MKIEVYAALKDFFEKEFTISLSLQTIAELKEYLIQKNIAAEQLLSICRFAVNDEFVDINYKLKPNDHIHIIPPSSGG